MKTQNQPTESQTNDVLQVEIARRRQAEEDGQVRQDYLQAIIDNSSECMKVVAADGTLLAMNRAGLDMVEAESADCLLGKNVFELVVPEHREQFRAMHDRVCRGAKERLEFQILGLKGTTRWMETNAVPVTDPQTGQKVHLAITRDVTQRKLAYIAQRQLAAIVESSDDAIISKNLQGVITSWNKSAEALFGYAAHEVIGKPVTVLIPENYINEEPDILDRIRRGERIDHYETVRRRKDGTFFNVSLTVSPLKDDAGNVVGASKIARDITDRVRAKEKLEQTVIERTSQLRDTVGELEAFSYSVAHDMRAPLRSMNSYSRLLQEDFAAALPPQAKDFVRRISAGAERLDALITDVLNYSKISRCEMELEAIEVEKLTRDIIDSYPDLLESGATILVQSPLPPVVGNTAGLTQCISNLLTNAVKFVATGTVPQVKIWAERKEEWVRLWIEDNGIGISEEGQKRIFQMFQRLNSAGDFEGTGIGLTIVRKAVDRMGGRVGVESRLGAGSRFWIELKRAA